MSEPAKKKAKTMTDFVKSPESSSCKETFDEFLKNIQKDRQAVSILKDLIDYIFFSLAIKNVATNSSNL